MKFSTVLLATAASAAVVERDASVVTGVLKSVGSNVDKLDAAANAYNGDKGPIVTAADALIKSLTDGKTKVDGSDKLTPTDGLALVDPVKDLTKRSTKLVDDLKSKRDQVEKAGECDTVREKLTSINSDSQALIKSVVAKVPDSLSDIAASLSKGLTDVLSQAADDFSESNCKNSGGSGGDKTTSAAGGDKTTSAGGGDQTSTPAGGDQTSAAPTASETETGPATTTPPVAGAASFAPAAALAAIAAAFAL